MISPVAIFVYNRVDNTQQTVQALLRNTLAKETDVYVFSDGGKNEESWKQVNEVRAYLHEVKREVEANGGLRSITLVERPENIYLERNIIEGIAYVLDRHDTVIVLEDDIVTSPYYLEYMNEAFDMYREEKRVMHVAGFTNLDLLSSSNEWKGSETYFTPHMSGWGWGTWKDRWQTHFHHYETEEEALEGMTEADINAIQYDGVFPCLKSLKKRPIPWDICWEMEIYKAGGLCLTPAHTMVRNIGLQNGTHFRAYSILQHYEFDREPLQRKLKLEKQVPEKNPDIELLFKDAIRDWGIRYTWLGKVVRWGYKKIKASAKPKLTEKGFGKTEAY